MSSMTCLSLCCGTAAVRLGATPARLELQDGQTSRFWRLPQSEAYGATVPKNEVILEELTLPSAVSLPAPRYEDSGLVLDEVVLEEALLGATVQRGAPWEGDVLDLSVPPQSAGVARINAVLPETKLLLMKVDALEAMLQGIGSQDDEIEREPWIEHTVAAGELLVDISQKYGILTTTICQANGIANTDRLTLGQVLLIPRTEGDLDAVMEKLYQRKGKTEAEAAKNRSDRISYQEYVVKPGDSLWAIANAYDLMLDSIYGCNALKNPDVLTPGTKLRIPNQDGLSVRVAKGQSVSLLAKDYGVTESAIFAANGMDAGDVLQVGQELFIPGASQAIAAYRRNSAGGGASGRAPSVARGNASIHFQWPVVGRINSPFGWRNHPIGKTRSFHSGIDIKASRHTPIKAAQAGQVIFAGWMNGYGRTVIIRHDGNHTTLYAHAQKLLVSKGQRVSQGSIIAHVGSSGRTTGPHLHFEVRSSNKPANPMQYLR